MTEIVGILNVTPDSFSDGGQFTKTGLAIKRVEEMFREGAHLIDVGAESTRPKATEVAIEEEWERLAPVLEKLKQHYPAHLFSIDTRRGEIATRAVNMWSEELTINDISGLSDSRMVEVVTARGLRIILGHLPARSQGNVAYAHQIQKMTNIWEVRDQLITSYLQAIGRGVKAENIILDPGIGFGKSANLNHRLIGFAALVPTIPVMVGYSRKRFLGTSRLDLNVNVEAGLCAVRTGVSFLRVHDVLAHYRMVQKEKQRMAML